MPYAAIFSKALASIRAYRKLNGKLSACGGHIISEALQSLGKREDVPRKQPSKPCFLTIFLKDPFPFLSN
jgi:hypothetical protein